MGQLQDRLQEVEEIATRVKRIGDSGPENAVSQASQVRLPRLGARHSTFCGWSTLQRRFLSLCLVNSRRIGSLHRVSPLKCLIGLARLTMAHSDSLSCTGMFGSST